LLDDRVIGSQGLDRTVDNRVAIDGERPGCRTVDRGHELALEGVRAENSVGTRTILDVLDAEQELLNSQVLLVIARRDAYVAGFQLLNSMGQAEAQDLGLDGGALYDPLGNYRRVARDWNDWSNDPRHNPVSTSTITPAETPPGVIPASQGVIPPSQGVTPASR
jgi:outer membrane protein